MSQPLSESGSDLPGTEGPTELSSAADVVGVVVQCAQPDDLDAIVELRRIMFAAMGTAPDALADPLWSIAARAWFEAALTDASACIVVALLDGEVVSGAVGQVTDLIPSPSCPNGRCGLLSNVATREAARGRGLGGRCTDAVLDWFDRETDVTRVDLFATSAGRSIYARRGFVESAHPSMRRPTNPDR